MKRGNINGWSRMGRIVVCVQNSRWPAALLLCSQGFLLAVGACLHSPTRDEPYHLSRGLHVLTTGRFDHSIGNPPLVEVVAALPIRILFPDFRFQTHRYVTRGNWPDGYSLRWIFALSRWACIPFSMIGAYVCCRWAGDLYGRRAGLCALSLYCFCPNMLAFGQQITCDAAAAAIGLAATYVFWKWLLAPTWTAAWLAGAVLGVAELTKMVWVILFLVWPAAWLISQACRGAVATFRQSCREALQLALILACAVAIINVAYTFGGTMRRLSDYPVLTAAAFDGETPSVFRNVPLPLPKDYLGGIEAIDQELGRPRLSYLRGQWKDGGWQLYYLYAMAVKLPIGTLTLLVAASWLSVRYWRRNVLYRHFPFRARCVATTRCSLWRREIFPLAVGVAVLVLVSSLLQNSSHHFRYALPVLPFIFVFAGKSAQWVVARRSVGAWLTGTAWLAAIIGSLWVYPHSLSFFNLFAGGPVGGRNCLVDSNLDWGQDLYFLTKWLKSHSEVKKVKLAYFGSTDPSLVDLKYELPARRPFSRQIDTDSKPNRPTPGWYAVSVNFVMGRGGDACDNGSDIITIESRSYSYFKDLTPVGRAGYSIDIYYLTPNDVRRIGEQR